MTEPDPPIPFGVAVVAAHGFSAPGLVEQLDRLLVRLTARHRHRPIVVWTVLGQPACSAAGEVCRRHGWVHQFAVPHPDGPREWAVLRECVAMAATAGALVVLAGETVPDSTRRLVWLCEWLGTPHRVVRVGGRTLRPEVPAYPDA